MRIVVIMDVSIFIAQAANLSVTGQLNVLDLGGDVFGPPPLSAIVLIVTVKTPADWEDGKTFDLSATLVDGNDDPVTIPSQDGPQVLRIQGIAAVPDASMRPPNIRGSATIVTEIGAGALIPPGEYSWMVTIDGETQPEWRTPIYIRSKPGEYPPTIRARPAQPQRAAKETTEPTP